MKGNLEIGDESGDKTSDQLERPDIEPRHRGSSPRAATRQSSHLSPPLLQQQQTAAPRKQKSPYITQRRKVSLGLIREILTLN